MLSVLLATLLIAPGGSPDDIDRAALDRTGVVIREAFARGDVGAIMACHHSQVEKSFGPGSRLVGKAAVQADLAASLSGNRIEFLSNTVESMLIEGNVAVEQARFAIRGTPVAGGPPWLFSGRTQVVYVRDPGNPCGWATIRELVQPSN